jgi:hypothetical protein
MPEIKKAAEKLPQAEKIRTLTQKVAYQMKYRKARGSCWPLVGMALHALFAAT